MAKLYKDRSGNKLYPVCNWERNQHKLYSTLDRAYLKMVDSDYSEEACEEHEQVERLIDVFNNYVINGLVYAPYKDGVAIKELIAAYDVRGDYIRYSKGDN